jgi:hypothetical protein
MGTTKTAIVKPEVKELDHSLALFREKLSSITVTNQEEWRAAGAFVVEVRAFKKRVNFVLGPFLQIAKDALAAAKNEVSRYTDVADEIDIAVSIKAETWLRQEKERTAEEERKRNAEKRRIEEAAAAERRKADEAKAEAEIKLRQKQIEMAQKAGELKKKEAEALKKKAEEDALAAKKLAAEQEANAVQNIEEVKVLPSIPTVAGIRRRVNYYATCEDADKLIKAAHGNGFLLQFITIDQSAIAKFARETKDDAKVQQAIPGVRAWHEDSI